MHEAVCASWLGVQKRQVSQSVLIVEHGAAGLEHSLFRVGGRGAERSAWKVLLHTASEQQRPERQCTHETLEGDCAARATQTMVRGPTRLG